MTKIYFGNVAENVVTREEFPLKKAIKVLKNKTIAVIGYGVQGPAQALNLRDNGFSVIIGQRKNSPSWKKALQDGWIEEKTLFSIEDAAKKADVICYLLSDAAQIALWPVVKKYLSKGKVLYFSHGFAITYAKHTGIIPPKNIDVILVAPKGTGLTLRKIFLEGRGVNSSFAVYQNSSGKAEEIVKAMGIGIGSGFLFPTTFEKEVFSDLTGERGVLMGAIAGIMEAQYELLRGHGHSPSEAFNETVEELTQSLIPLISEKGMDWMFANCSTTAQRGALDWKDKFKKAVAPVFKNLYFNVASGHEAEVVIKANSKPDYKEKLQKELKKMRESEMWQAGEKVESYDPNIKNNMNKITTKQIEEASKKMNGVILQTPLQYCKRLSKKYSANIYIKREDLQEVRSFKIRGAYNKLCSLNNTQKKQGIVSASTGNHAQGVALSCYLLKIHGVIFMPETTPLQKIDKVKHFGDGLVEIKLVGQIFDEAYLASKKFCEEKKASYIHPFNDIETIIGQGTIGFEIYKELGDKVDVIISPVGGGGIAAGIASYIKQKKPKVNIFGVEAQGAAGMNKSFQEGHPVSLEKIDTFVEGAAVSTVGELTYALCKKNLNKIVVVPVGLVCSAVVELYQNEGIIAEPAGALSIAALENLKEEIKGKTVVCILSGGNNDLLRYPEIMEKSLVWQGRKHYFLIEFAQKPGQLRTFVDKALGPGDDIVRFEYMKKTNKEKGAALVGVELSKKEDLEPLLKKMKEVDLNFKILDQDNLLYQYLI